MPYTGPLTPVAEAIYGALIGDATLLALTTSIHTDLPQNPTLPALWIELNEPEQFGGFGTKPGLKTLPEIDVRLHTYSTAETWAEADAISARAIAVLADSSGLSPTGYSAWALFHDRTLRLPDEALNGVKVKEMVSMHRLYVEEAA